ARRCAEIHRRASRGREAARTQIFPPQRPVAATAIDRDQPEGPAVLGGYLQGAQSDPSADRYGLDHPARHTDREIKRVIFLSSSLRASLDKLGMRAKQSRATREA